MGTLVSQRLFGRRSRTAARKALRRVTELEELWSYFSPSSDVGRINGAAGVHAVTVVPETIQVLGIAQRIGELSAGAFDVTCAPLRSLWRRAGEEHRLPSQREIDAQRQLVDYRDLHIDPSRSTVYLPRVGQAIDLGGIGKGYAADEMIKIYRRYGIRSGFVNLGGTVVTQGSRPDGSPWRVGIRRPPANVGTDPSQLIGSVAVRDSAVVTSGTYEDRFEYNGRYYHHIIDPAHGFPSDCGVYSATIIGGSAAEADALATAVCVLGSHRGRTLIDSLEGIEVIIVVLEERGEFDLNEIARRFHG